MLTIDLIFSKDQNPYGGKSHGKCAAKTHGSKKLSSVLQDYKQQHSIVQVRRGNELKERKERTDLTVLHNHN